MLAKLTPGFSASMRCAVSAARDAVGADTIVSSL
jgi:hypothetical protein